MSATFTATVSAGLRNLEANKLSTPSARFAKVAVEAVALAEVEGVAEIVDESVRKVEGMSVARKRMLALDVALLIAAFLTLAAWLSQSPDPKDLKGEAIALACAAALVRLYWRLTGKLD